jgi:hypothetical protein
MHYNPDQCKKLMMALASTSDALSNQDYIFVLSILLYFGITPPLRKKIEGYDYYQSFPSYW